MTPRRNSKHYRRFWRDHTKKFSALFKDDSPLRNPEPRETRDDKAMRSMRLPDGSIVSEQLTPAAARKARRRAEVFAIGRRKT